jgi:putative peptidoglycan lipid II flippase
MSEGLAHRVRGRIFRDALGAWPPDRRVSAATFLSRVLGPARPGIRGVARGTAADAFNMAFRVPNLVRDLFAEGAMSASFVPTFTDWREKQGDEAAWALGRQLMSTLLAVLLGLCALGWVFAPQLIGLMAGGFGAVPGKLALTVTLTRIMLPFLPAVALAAAAMGMPTRAACSSCPRSRRRCSTSAWSCSACR